MQNVDVPYPREFCQIIFKITIFEKVVIWTGAEKANRSEPYSKAFVLEPKPVHVPNFIKISVQL